ncbi:MAG: hypothetical protein R6U68_11815 [Desulfobacteraceae bacterium]
MGGAENIIDKVDVYVVTRSAFNGVDPALEPMCNQLNELNILVEDLASGLSRYAQTIELDTDQLSEVEERLATLDRLQRKHGMTIDELIKHTYTLRDELNSLESSDEQREKQQQALQKLRKQAEQQAQALSKARQKAAKKLAKEVTALLPDLGMPGGSLVVDVQSRSPRESDDPNLRFGDRQLTP